ncbi:hypothetical protein [Mycobacterium sp. MMS18-G62]
MRSHCNAAPSGKTVVDIAMPWAVFRLGEVIRGHVNLTPVYPRAYADLIVHWEREELTVRIDGPIIQLAKRIRLRIGVPVAVPFELPLPMDAPASGSGMDSLPAWFVVARLNYRGSSSVNAERVRCPITVVTAAGG